jgi:hypothetical protein
MSQRGKKSPPSPTLVAATEVPIAPALPSCASCKHFLRKDEATGLCRRYPPTQPTNTLTNDGRILTHPLVLVSDYCGEHTSV